jgi:hypothetical protein
MSTSRLALGAGAMALVLFGLAFRAVTVHSVGAAPLVYRVTVNNNDLDTVEGLAPPGRVVELWYRQRNFKEGNDGLVDPFGWCAWKGNGLLVQLGVTQADAAGVWRLTGLRERTTVMLFPAGPAGDRCLGGLYTELLPRACDTPGVNCTVMDAPKLHWLNVRTLTSTIGAAAGSVSDAEQAAMAVADGPNDGPEFSDVVDVDQNGIDTTQPGFFPGQRVTWRCGGGGTATCPSVTVHDGSTVVAPDPEYPYLLGSMQAHRGGGSFFAAAAIRRSGDLGPTFNVNVRFRGLLNVNLGCDRKRFFDFSVPFV